MMFFTAEQAKKIASSKKYVDYYAKIAEIENKIINAANDYKFSIGIYLCGEGWTMHKEDIDKIKRVLKQSGYRIDYDNHIGYLEISWK